MVPKSIPSSSRAGIMSYVQVNLDTVPIESAVRPPSRYICVNSDDDQESSGQELTPWHGMIQVMGAQVRRCGAAGVWFTGFDFLVSFTNRSPPGGVPCAHGLPVEARSTRRCRSTAADRRTVRCASESCRHSNRRACSVWAKALYPRAPKSSPLSHDQLHRDLHIEPLAISCQARIRAASSRRWYMLRRPRL